VDIDSDDTVEIHDAAFREDLLRFLHSLTPDPADDEAVWPDGADDGEPYCVQIIDGAANSTYGFVEVTEPIFRVLFPGETTIAWVDEVDRRVPPIQRTRFWRRVYARDIDKRTLFGIDGTLHLTGSPANRAHFPNRTEADIGWPSPLHGARPRTSRT
jgi:hypothetical protein